MRTDTEGLWHILTTLGVRTFLRGVVRCHGNKLAASMFGFALKVLSQYPPGCISYSEGQTMVTYHVGRFQVFNHDGLIAVYIMARGFMQGIFTLISNAFVMTRYVVLGFLASAASLLTLSKLTLSMSQLLRTRLRMFGVLNDMA